MDARLSLILRCSLAVMVLALAVALLTAPPPARAIQGTGFYCSKTAIFDTTPPGTGTTPNATARVIQADGSPNQIYICGYTISVGTQPTSVGIQYGKGINCGTGTTWITPYWQVQAAEFMADNSPGWRGMLVPSGNDVCIITYSSSAKAVQAIIFYEVAP